MSSFSATRTRVPLLAALLFCTLGTAPLVRAQTPDSVSIPLQILPLAGGAYRLGIDISIGGAPSRTYLLDTGSQPFFSGYYNGAVWWGNATPTGASGNYGYTGGFAYHYNVVTTNVTLGGNPLATAVNVNMGQVVAKLLGPEKKVDQSFVDLMEAGKPPEGNLFWGTLGANPMAAQDGFFSILGQLPGNLSNGFIIHTGGRGGNASLTLGPTDTLRSKFPITVPMEGQNTTVTFPNSGQPTYQEALLTGQILVSNGNTSYAVVVPVILDTGDPSSVLYQDLTVAVPSALVTAVKSGNTTTNYLGNGTTFTLSVQGEPGSTNWVWNFIAGQLQSNNQVVLEQGGGNLNTGLSEFFSFDVMFDLQNGVIGFRALPAPTVGLKVNGAEKRMTRQTKITLRGTATASSVVSFVGVVVPGRKAQIASGTTSWQATVPLNYGQNTISVRAHSVDGLVTPAQKIVVRRY